MKFYFRLKGVAIGLIALGLSSVANAALVDRGGGLIYDQDLNVTWLANANINGPMSWNDAMTWASNLSYYDSVRNVTYSDWRLPTSDTCVGLNCTGSDMGHLFYSELGGVGGQSIATTHNANYSLFSNILSGGYYWAGTEYAPNTNQAWTFCFGAGAQGPEYKVDYDYTYFRAYAMAVRPGDVGATTVPAPAAIWLFGSGLLGLVGMSRKRRR